MHRLDKKTPRDDKFLNPSFSSTLLDQIYRSIDEGERKSSEMKFYRETIAKKQSRSNGKSCNGDLVEEEQQGNRKDKKIVGTEPCFSTQHRDPDHDQDVLFFSSTSISSDSSSGGFSSSDTESMCRVKSRASRALCFAPPRPKPVRTSVSFRSDRNEKQATRMFGGFCHHSKTEDIGIQDEKALFKSKSRALKIYNNLKKVKQPISPGGRLTNFLNSLFTTGNTKKTRSTCYEDVNAERKAKSVQASTCSSASSFSRSCLSKTLSSEREKLSNGVKRTVRFYPVSVIVDEDSRPCGHKSLYEEKGKSLMVPVSVPTAWKIGRRSPTKKKDEEIKLPVMEKSKMTEEAARELLEEYRHNHKKNDLVLKKSDLILKDLPLRTNNNDNEEDEDDDDDDDAASYASSDLFELDHLAVMGNDRYCEELPVYETTHVSTNRAIANGLIG